MSKWNKAPGEVILKFRTTAFELYRPINGLGEPMKFLRLRCQCGKDELEVDKIEGGEDDGKWAVECPDCGEAAMLEDLTT